MIVGRVDNKCNVVVDEVEKRTKFCALVLKRQFAVNGTFTVNDSDI